jgi:hypothetical protein
MGKNTIIHIFVDQVKPLSKLGPSLGKCGRGGILSESFVGDFDCANKVISRHVRHMAKNFCRSRFFSLGNPIVRENTVDWETFSVFGSYPLPTDEPILNEERWIFQLTNQLRVRTDLYTFASLMNLLLVFVSPFV